MELSQLAIFQAVARYSSFSEAARKLYISHSTASRAVLALEKELGVKLMERSSHFVELTAAGELLAREGGSLLELERSLCDRVRAAGGGSEAE